MELAGVSTHSPTRITGERHEAAVLTPILAKDGVPHLLFTKRADHLGEHPGQMSFPGGGREPSDETLFETALREAREEIGLARSEAEFVGQLDDIRTVTRYSVTPFVVEIPDRTYRPDEREVAEIAVLPVTGFIDSENYECEHRDHPHYGEIVIHFFHVEGYTVWGATARILVQFLELTTDWRAPDRVDRTVDREPDL